MTKELMSWLFKPLPRWLCQCQSWGPPHSQARCHCTNWTPGGFGLGARWVAVPTWTMIKWWMSEKVKVITGTLGGQPFQPEQSTSYEDSDKMAKAKAYLATGDIADMILILPHCYTFLYCFHTLLAYCGQSLGKEGPCPGCPRQAQTNRPVRGQKCNTCNILLIMMHGDDGD